ncbi:TonB-dependent receptor plug domain-containing protein [Fibrella forsythiae]|uniref:TonB-dependent receptor plug domain-containing protein n=1 Tax=Fibrella forsythiae TaxID=2817061 RepID=A0ABS3JBS3_9BACT|nr:TonB-dependent receptor [Fibrella forsythiae]MBO0947433.1 TonB-dependent receptor plug domain-containing protein [Fibrella forsythiae]
MTFRFTAVLLWFSALGISHAQDSSSVRQLQTVTVRGFAPERFMAGLKIQRADSALTEAYRYQTLADFLALQAPMQFKSYGPGQLTTVGLRGTSANHTAVLWNGVNINPPTLGQTDFSTIPVNGFDQLSIQYGSAASCVGSDAIGGSILLNSTPGWKRQGITATLGHRFGSWNSGQTQVGVRFATPLPGGGQLAGKTLVYGGTNRYLPTYSERKGYLVEPSETAQRGVIQDLFYRTKQQHQLSLNIWLTDNKLVIAPANPVSREITRTQAYRFLTNYEFGESKPGRWLSGRTLLRAGFIRDILDYGKGDDFDTAPSHSATDRLLVRAEHELEQSLGTSGQSISIRAGAEWVHYTARVDGYVNGALTEQRADLYALIRYQLTARLVTALNLRQAFVTRYDPPFTPSFGIEYRLLNLGTWRLDGRGNVARSYRVPTLNERYWKTLGNPDIRPERGFSQDLGLNLSDNVPGRSTSLSVSAFRNHVDDWTYWNPAKGYRVENLQEVLARGVEVQGQTAWQLGTWRVGAFGQYAYTRSTQLRVYDPSAIDVVGKQLIYLPLHTASANVFVQQGLHRLALTWQGSDRRASTFDNSKYLPEYQLVNLLFETAIRVRGWQGKAVVQVDNLFNEFYLNVKNNVMPGRSVALTLVFTANTKPDQQ